MHIQVDAFNGSNLTPSRRRTNVKMLLDGGWRFQRCCCFNVKTGTTILGVLATIGSIMLLIAACVSPNDAAQATPKTIKNHDVFRNFIPVELNLATRLIYGTAALISTVLGALLVYGNCNNLTKFMTPFVYWSICWWVLSFIMMLIWGRSVPNASGDDGPMPVAVLIVSNLIGIVIGLLFLQVIRSRIADIKEGGEAPFNGGFQRN